MATTTDEVDEIRRKMAWIRRELREDVLGVVESAEEITDWKHYIRDYPWASVALAAAVGFMLVPKRRTVKSAEVARAVAAEIQPTMTMQAAALAPEKKGRGLIGAGLALLAPIVLRVAQNYATHFVTNWVAQQQEQMAAHMMAAAMGPRQGEPGPGMGRPGGPSQTQGGMR
ncbi:MAG TPA: hypothetical protein VGH33_15415 [Isosphaeraceae bacterium]